MSPPADDSATATVSPRSLRRAAILSATDRRLWIPFLRWLAYLARADAPRQAVELDVADPRACDSVARVSFDSLVIILSAFVAGMINAVAGGGTLVSFPALLWIGRDPIVANVTSTIGLCPASFGAAVGFRRELAKTRRWIRALLLALVRRRRPRRGALASYAVARFRGDRSLSDPVRDGAVRRGGSIQDGEPPRRRSKEDSVPRLGEPLSAFSFSSRCTAATSARGSAS